ncbi:MAG: lysozyme inhibitor LprI family protein [Lachnospiraceae bacterium]
MKRNMVALFLAGTMVLSVCGCTDREPEKTVDGITIEIENSQDKDSQGEKSQSEDPSEEGAAETTDAVKDEKDVFSFADLKNIEFWFASGAGAWSTDLTIHADGSFSGEYHDSDMGDTGEGYPKGTRYLCNFSGQFTKPVKVNEYTYSMQIQDLSCDEEVGKEKIMDGVLYRYSEAYGLEGAENILIYLPGAPLSELPEEFRSWVGYNDLSNTTETELPFYGLNNEAKQYGFASYDIVENMKTSIGYTEERAAELENSIKNDSLSQAEYNEKAQELYELWDSDLNELWGILKRTKDAETMRALTVEEREWIEAKEQAAAKAGAEFEGGSMQQMVTYQKAAEMTKARVYELLELLD